VGGCVKDKVNVNVGGWGGHSVFFYVRGYGYMEGNWSGCFHCGDGSLDDVERCRY
jgi:hypothetical protein